MRTTILVCLLAFIMISDAKYWIRQNDDRVKVDIYIESLCSDTINFILKSLKPAASTKVRKVIFRIFGKYVTSTFTHMEMLKDKEMEQVGHSHVNMDPDNVKET